MASIIRSAERHIERQEARKVYYEKNGTMIGFKGYHSRKLNKDEKGSKKLDHSKGNKFFKLFKGKDKQNRAKEFSKKKV